MPEMTYTKKEIRTTFDTSNSAFLFLMDKPTLCPICNAYVDSIKTASRLFTGDEEPYYGIVQSRCLHCKKQYLVAYEITPSTKSTRVAGFFPAQSSEYQNNTIEQFSPGFIRYYNQAQRAEIAGDIELAATGYRTALENLVKDYAITELQRPREEVVRKKLFDAIGEYLGERDLIATADVVRLIGNDYTHYERRYPQHDLTLLKKYLEIFVRLVETKYMIAHPPVSR